MGPKFVKKRTSENTCLFLHISLTKTILVTNDLWTNKRSPDSSFVPIRGVILVENKDAIENNLLWFVLSVLAHTCYIQCKLSTALYKLLMASKHGKN